MLAIADRPAPPARRGPASLFAALLWCAGCAAGEDGATGDLRAAPPPSAESCVEIKVWSNGYHTSLALPGAAFGRDHPIRDVYPEAEHFLIGFGDLAWYQAGQTGVGAAMRAAGTPTPGVLHVIAADEPIEERIWRPTELRAVAVSREGLAAIAEGVAASIELEAREGGAAPIVVGEGRAPDRSVFLAANQDFHFFYMCNHWTAERLAAAGVDIAAEGALRAAAVMNAVEDAPSACPEP